MVGMVADDLDPPGRADQIQGLFLGVEQVFMHLDPLGITGELARQLTLPASIQGVKTLHGLRRADGRKHR